MTKSVRDFLALSLAGIVTLIAHSSVAETTVQAHENVTETPELIRSDRLEDSNSAANPELESDLDEDSVVVADAEPLNPEAEVSVAEEDSTQRIPLTSRIFPCDSMQQ